MKNYSKIKINKLLKLTVKLALQIYLVNYQDILQSFVDLNLYVKVKNVQQLEEFLQENDELLNNEYHVQVFYLIKKKINIFQSI